MNTWVRLGCVAVAMVSSACGGPLLGGGGAVSGRTPLSSLDPSERVRVCEDVELSGFECSFVDSEGREATLTTDDYVDVSACAADLDTFGGVCPELTVTDFAALRACYDGPEGQRALSKVVQCVISR